MTGFVAALGLAGSAAAAVLQAQGDAFAPADCTVERLQAKAARGTTITAAAMVDAAERVPAHCRVDGHAASPGNTVNFRLGLPVRGTASSTSRASAGSAARSAPSTPD